MNNNRSLKRIIGPMALATSLVFSANPVHAGSNDLMLPKNTNSIETLQPSDLVFDQTPECVLYYKDGTQETIQGDFEKKDIIQWFVEEAKKRNSNEIHITLPKNYYTTMTQGIDISDMHVSISGDKQYPATIYKNYEYDSIKDAPFHSERGWSVLNMDNINFSDAYSQFVVAYSNGSGIFDVKLQKVKTRHFDIYEGSEIIISDSEMDTQFCVHCGHVKYDNCKIGNIDITKTPRVTFEGVTSDILSLSDISKIDIKGLKSKTAILSNSESVTLEGVKIPDGRLELNEIQLAQIKLSDVPKVIFNKLPDARLYKCRIPSFTAYNSFTMFTKCLFPANEYYINGDSYLRFDKCVNSSGDHIKVSSLKNGSSINIPSSGVITSNSNGNLFKRSLVNGQNLTFQNRLKVPLRPNYKPSDSQRNAIKKTDYNGRGI